MDRLNDYRNIIEQIVRNLAKLKYAYGEIDRMAVVDREGDHYLLMIAGWDERRVHGCIVHVDIIDGKFWIQRDGTEDGVTLDLEAAGVPKDRIVLAFKDPSIRPHTGYAVT